MLFNSCCFMLIPHCPDHCPSYLNRSGDYPSLPLRGFDLLNCRSNFRICEKELVGPNVISARAMFNKPTQCLEVPTVLPVEAGLQGQQQTAGLIPGSDLHFLGPVHLCMPTASGGAK